MPITTYIIRFAHRVPTHSAPYEEQEYPSRTDAWESFRLFAEPNSADLYSLIELAEYNYAEYTQHCWVRLEFSPIS